MLPVKSLFSNVVLHYKTVFGYFRTWCKSGVLQQIWFGLLNKYRASLDMSSVDLDGSHTPALRGGEQVAYQGRKKRKTTNALYLTDRQGIPLAISDPIEGNHNDLHQIKERFTDIIDSLNNSDIRVDGLFLNADAGFDSAEFREFCSSHEIIPNIAINWRNAAHTDDIFFDELLYQQRYCIERTNAWMDSFRSLLNRFDVTCSSWQSFNLIAFIVILLKKITKQKKSR
ncbi:transposase [Microbacter margulisiae]|uniref:Transposase n=2 Tax=Microbacter margulisiae TaxID=1350067 RepID=A0A7W5DTA9_9PORP|nr:transposase [Microbacter margulisiae]MBB3186537.1 transposase [Microbacter margulisiae]MBB3186540.1 transposase [Microbacter margulisiae]MBB3186704.1 transposase [Microbacter margulisiae]MBB3186812.1 transposase [Microbacter margulisiae]